MKLSNKILEAVRDGISLALDDYGDNDVMPVRKAVYNDKISSIDGYILDAIKNNDIDELPQNLRRKLFNNVKKYLNMLGITDELFYIIRYIIDNYNEDYLVPQLKQLYDAYSSIFKTKYRKVTSKKVLRDIIEKTIKEEGPNCDLNWIDTSEITDMSSLFMFGRLLGIQCKEFNGDISKWDTSNVKSMANMFGGLEKFNCDISNWDTSNVEDMAGMFWICTNFNQDISKWNISKVKNMEGMFLNAESFNQDLSNWDLRNVNTNIMFAHANNVKMSILPEFKPKGIIDEKLK